VECATRPCRQGTVSGGCASKSRNTLARCGPWQQVIRFSEPQRSQGAGSPKQWQPGHARHGRRDDGLGMDYGSPTFTPGSTRERSTLLRRPFIHAIEGHHQNIRRQLFIAGYGRTCCLPLRRRYNYVQRYESRDKMPRNAVSWLCNSVSVAAMPVTKGRSLAHSSV
jgi:hypothetical protein